MLLLHHSPEVVAYPLGITESSRSALLDAVDSLGITLVLTGHAHNANWHIHKVVGGALHELRCGTTTQRRTAPRDLGLRSEILGRLRDLPLNSALVHRIFEDGSRVRWESQQYVVKTTGGPFEAERRIGSFPLL
jgi:hypothetical protein